MAGILRGDIFWANLNPVVGREQAGHRPVLILSNNTFNKYSGTVIAMALTSRPQRAGFPLTFALDDERLPKKSWVKISQIRTLPFGLPEKSRQKVAFPLRPTAVPPDSRENGRKRFSSMTSLKNRRGRGDRGDLPEKSR